MVQTSEKRRGGSPLSMMDSDWEEEGGVNIAAALMYRTKYRIEYRIGKI